MEEIYRFIGNIHGCWYFILFRNYSELKCDVRKYIKNSDKPPKLLSFQYLLFIHVVHSARNYLVNRNSLYNLQNLLSLTKSFEIKKIVNGSCSRRDIQHDLWYCMGRHDHAESGSLFRQINLYDKLFWINKQLGWSSISF